MVKTSESIKHYWVSRVLIVIITVVTAAATWILASMLCPDAQVMRIDPQALRAKDCESADTAGEAV